MAIALGFPIVRYDFFVLFRAHNSYALQFQVGSIRFEEKGHIVPTLVLLTLRMHATSMHKPSIFTSFYKNLPKAWCGFSLPLPPFSYGEKENLASCSFQAKLPPEMTFSYPVKQQKVILKTLKCFSRTAGMSCDGHFVNNGGWYYSFATYLLKNHGFSKLRVILPPELTVFEPIKTTKSHLVDSGLL